MPAFALRSAAGSPSRCVAALAAAALSVSVLGQVFAGSAAASAVHVSASVPASASAPAWASAPAVVAGPTSLGYDPGRQDGAMTNVVGATGAINLWKRGITGKGVDVAVLDTGIAPVPTLTGSGKVVVGADLSFESQSPQRHLDTYGHGTHMAGIIAGREGVALTGPQYVAASGTSFYGMAPDARIVSVKLGDHDGAVDVSQVIAGINWVIKYRNTDGMNIRVINLSYGAMTWQRSVEDPLDQAVDRATRAGIVVVASAGNFTTVMGSPATDPNVISVAASDAALGTTLAPFSSWYNGFSTTADKPNSTTYATVAAPGVGIIGPGVAGSALYVKYPGARIGNGYLRGSGTSQASAVVSGAVALLLQSKPWLTPARVKARLVGSAVKLRTYPDIGGRMNIDRADLIKQPVTKTYPVSTGNGYLDLLRLGSSLSIDGVVLTGEQDIFGKPWNPAATWGDDGTFNGSIWTGTSFAADSSAAGSAWGGRTWSGVTWTGRTWSGGSWNGRTWSNSTWTGAGWSSATWPSTTTRTGFTAFGWTADIWG